MENQSTETKNEVKGELTFEDKVIQKIIGITLANIDGLLTIDGGFFSNIKDKLVNSDDVTTGINIELGKKQVAVDMDIIVEYGKDIAAIYEKMKELITKEVKEMTHLEVIEVNANVIDIKTRAEYEATRGETVQGKLTSAAEATAKKVTKSKAEPAVADAEGDARVE